MDDAANSRFIRDAIEADGDLRAIFARLSGLIGLHLLAGKNGKAVEAVDMISKAIEMEPADAELYNERALAYMAEGDFKRAAGDLSEAIKLDPDKIDYYAARGSVYLREKEYDGAIADLGRVRLFSVGAATHESEKAALYLAIAYILRSIRRVNAGELEPAKLDFEKAEAIVGGIAEVSAKFREVHGLFGDLKELLTSPARF
jgi:tetratricopeptide (TPR) repeat protein